MKQSMAREFSQKISDMVKESGADIQIHDRFVSLGFEDGSCVQIWESIVIPVTCPKCGQAAQKIDTKYGRRDECYDCGLWSWNGKELVDRETHEARRTAHQVFDDLWKSSRMSRSEAYGLLAKKLGLSAEECHMGQMTKETALLVPDAVRDIRKDLSRSNVEEIK